MLSPSYHEGDHFGAARPVGLHPRLPLGGFLPIAAGELGDIALPPGFRIDLYAADVPNARQMPAGPAGIVFVGSRSEGKVYAVVDRDGDQRADQVHVLASGLNMPSGVAFRDESFYVAAVNRVLRFRDVSRRSTAPLPLPMMRTAESRLALYSLIRLAVISASGVSSPNSAFNRSS
jgi:hypothetical protein